MPASSRRTVHPSSRPAVPWPAAAILRMALRWAGRCVERARQRRALALLDDRLLRDVGLDRHDVERETGRAFWTF